jgi:hypothetical protein
MSTQSLDTKVRRPRTGTVRRRLAALAGVLVLAGVAATLATSADAASQRPVRRQAAAGDGPYVTFLFSRTEITAADGCVVDNSGIARLDKVVAPYLAARGWSGTGTLATGRTQAAAVTCTHSDSSMTASWNQATALATQKGWSFTSHTATYPSNLAGLTAAQSQAETCGSAHTIDQHGLPGGHGMISYPGAQPEPVALQTNYASHCFAWGRESRSNGVTLPSAAQTPPYWQQTVVANGGPCNVKAQPCYTVAATGGSRYQLPSRFTGYLRALAPGQWFTVQAFVLVRGKNPAYTASPIRWDCTAADPRLHWTNDNERYCYKDWQAVVDAVAAVPGVVVTDPLTVGIAFGRPATYP